LAQSRRFSRLVWISERAGLLAGRWPAFVALHNIATDCMLKKQAMVA
jgi:hypothetical protein